MSQLTNQQEKLSKTINLFIPCMPINWNNYINIERRPKGYFKANNIKQTEKQVVSLIARHQVYQGNYPIELILRPHFKDFRQDLDNFRYKGLLDGLVTSGVIRNDNLNAIRKITLLPVFDDTEGVEITIKELEQDGKDSV